MNSESLISVIIPTLNEAEHIGALLGQLLADAPQALLEILVVDGGSADGTGRIVEDFSQKDRRVRLLQNPARLQAAGVNLASLAADPRANVLVRLDAHAGYPAGYLAALLAALDANGADSVVVRLRTGGDGCFQKAVAAVSNSPLGTGGAAHRVGGTSRWIDHGHHAAFRRSSFERIGGYDPSFKANEDAEFDVRLRRSGGRIWFAADIEVAYYPRRTPGRLARQYFGYGTGRARNLLKNGERLKLRQLAPPILLVALTIAIIASPVWPYTLMLPVAYLAASALGALVLTVQARRPCLLLGAVALPVMHLAWGAGFLAAIMRGKVLARGARS